MAHWCWLDMKWCGSLSGLAVFVSCHFVSWCLPFSLVCSRFCCQLCCQHFPLVCSIAACSGFKWQAIKIQHFIIARNLLRGYVKIGAWEQLLSFARQNHKGELRKSADETEKRDKKKHISRLALYVPSGLQASEQSKKGKSLTEAFPHCMLEPCCK